MCRMAAYAGPPAPVNLLFSSLPHGLERQAYQPKQLLSGHVNVDGTGLVCWPEGARAPLRHASELPPWNDANLIALGASLSSGLQLAAVRSATPGQASGPAAAAPLLKNGLALSHNGFVTDFQGAGLPALLRALPEERWGSAASWTDSGLMFEHLLHVRAQSPDASLAESLERALARITAIVAAEGLSARLDVIVCDGLQLVAARRAVGLESNTLYRAGTPNGGIYVASEPLDAALDWSALAPDEVWIHAIERAAP